MPENDFEKRVQQKMEELRLPPSAEVWDEVEKRIRKEKERRRFILWFFLLGALLLGGAGLWIINGNKKHLPADNSVVQTTDKKINEITKAVKNNPQNETVSEMKFDSNSYKKEDQKAEEQATKNSISITETFPDKKILFSTKIKTIKKNEVDQNKAATNISENANSKKEKPVLPGLTKPDEPISIQKKGVSDSVIKTWKSINADTNRKTKDSVVTQKTIVSDNPTSITKPSVSALTDSLIAKDTEAVVKKIITKRKKNKWEFGVTAMTGTSKKSKGFSIFNGSNDALNAQANSPGRGAGGPITGIQPAIPGNGFSWQIGAYSKRKLNVRTGLSTGLNFSAYSTTQQTGAFVDSSRIFSSSLYSSSVQDFYRSGSAKSHKNHYYYLQIPVSFHWQINKSSRLPVIFQNGLSIGLFTGSDALVYNSNSNVFYHDNKSFNKLQLSYETGLYAKIFNRSKKPLTAGMLFNYHLSKLQKVNLNGGNHLTAFSFQLVWLIKK